MKLHRPTMMKHLRQEEEWDVCIIGGGATGLGIALEAAASGLRTALIEGRDFASGSSSRSTKLVHGGVRYLEQGKMSLVSEALKERDRLMTNAAGHVDDFGFLIPVKRQWARFYYGIGLRLYDLLAGSHRWGRTEWVGKREITNRLPHLAELGFIGAWRYRDGRFNDAELALGLAKTAAQHGAILANHCRAEGFIKEKGLVAGVHVQDVLTGEKFQLSAKVVVNACGPYSDAICRMDDPEHEDELRPSQGIHLVFDAEILKGGDALLIPKTDDGRVLFAVPWLGKVLVGTTDTPVDRSRRRSPWRMEDEVDFRARTTPTASWGCNYNARRHPQRLCRPPPPDPRAARRIPPTCLAQPRRRRMSPSGLVNVRGGKWTTYRKMAEDTVRFFKKECGLEFEPADTAVLALDMTNTQPRGMHPKDESELASAVTLAVEEEMCMTTEDFLARRYRTLFLDAKNARSSAVLVSELLSQNHGLNAEWAQRQSLDFQNLAQHYLPTP